MANNGKQCIDIDNGNDNGNGKHCNDNGSATSTAGFELQAALKAVKGLRFKATLSIVRRQISHDSPPQPYPQHRDPSTLNNSDHLVTSFLSTRVQALSLTNSQTHFWAVSISRVICQMSTDHSVWPYIFFLCCIIDCSFCDDHNNDGDDLGSPLGLSSPDFSTRTQYEAKTVISWLWYV